MELQTRDFVSRNYEGVSVVRFTSANLTSAADMQRALADLEGMVDQGVRKMVIDFKHVQYISSAALGMLIAINKKMKDAKGRLILSYPDKIMELLRISKTERLFTIAPDPKSAVASMQ